MKLLIQITLIFVACLFTKIGQSQSFALTDSTFQEGDKLLSNSIIFEYARASILNDKSPFLDSLTTFCLSHPNISIELGYHRDNRGSDYYSSDLTASRAKSAKNYLIKKGIPESQIQQKGYGASQLLIANSEIEKLATQEEKEKAHQLNRRIEITILKTD